VNTKLLKTFQITPTVLIDIKQLAKKRAKQQKAQSSERVMAPPTTEETAPTKINLLQLYKLNSSLKQLRKDDDKGYYTQSEARQLVWDYAKENGLDKGRTIELDDFLQAALGSSDSNVPKGELSKRIDGLLTLYYAVLPAGEEDSSRAKFRKGPIPTVEIRVETRQGRKQVTRIKGLEVFNIDAKQLAVYAQKKWACSTSVQALESSKMQNVEVLIQGNRSAEVSTYLTTAYGLPSNLIKIELKKPKAKGK